MKQRLIFHIDVNSAFLSWTDRERRLHNPELPGLLTIPAAIGGDSSKRHGIVLAKSPAARAMGVTTGEPLASALKKCPNLSVFPPDFKVYARNSAALMEFLYGFSPVLQQFSIDEAFLDMTDTIHLFGEPLPAAERLRMKIEHELGFTVNIGISSNKLLAKMASDFEKPNRCHTLFPEEIPKKMWPLPTGELYLVGRSARAKLALMGIRTIGELARADLSLLQPHLGVKYGAMIRQYANGEDDSPVEPEEPESKGIGNRTTLSHDVTDFEDACQILLLLSESVGARLRKSGRKCSCITVERRDADFHNSSHQLTLPSPTCSTGMIYDTSVRLLREFWNGTPLRLLGVRVSRLDDPAFEQLSLFPSEEGRKQEKQEKVDRAIDAIRERFGTDAVRRASVLSAHLPPAPEKNKGSFPPPLT